MPKRFRRRFEAVDLREIIATYPPPPEYFETHYYMEPERIAIKGQGSGKVGDGYPDMIQNRFHDCVDFASWDADRCRARCSRPSAAV